MRRLPGRILSLWRRRPITALALHLGLAWASLILSAALLFGWRQSSVHPGLWIALWLVVQPFQAGVWHWRLRASRLLWEERSLTGLRTRLGTR